MEDIYVRKATGNLDGDLEGEDVGILLGVAVGVSLRNWVGLMATDDEREGVDS